jgi:hypothetical protein
MQVVIPIITFLVGAVLGAVLGRWYGVYQGRPMLTIIGSGGGGGPGPGYHVTNVRLQNRPGLVGLRLNESILFGRQLHGFVERGLPVERNPARECSARLHDKKTGEFVAPLWWRRGEQPTPWQINTNLASGEEVELMLFARLDDEPSRYFPFAPADQRSSGATPVVPPPEARFEGTHDFYIEISYSYGRQRARFDASVKLGFDGRLSWLLKRAGGGSF